MVGTWWCWVSIRWDRLIRDGTGSVECLGIWKKSGDQVNCLQFLTERLADYERLSYLAPAKLQWSSRYNVCWRIVWRNPFKLDVHFLREKEIQEIAQYVTQVIQQPCYIFFVNRLENIFANHKLSWHRILALRSAEPTLEKFQGESPPRSPWFRYLI